MTPKTATKSETSDGGLAATYTLVYSFLTARSHEKAAAAVKKAAKDIVVLKDNVTVNEAPLDEIVKWWKAKREADAKNISSSVSSSESSSDSDSSDDSSSSDSSSSSDCAFPLNNGHPC
ncbi:hypothetical protein JB92DRAFT_492384 [Gautieria morchelliformis]|nr:hypothetical protein JB92DRAFT_492384 [Gautieria morchelliformis]